MSVRLAASGSCGMCVTGPVVMAQCLGSSSVQWDLGQIPRCAEGQTPCESPDSRHLPRMEGGHGVTLLPGGPWSPQEERCGGVLCSSPLRSEAP